MPKHWQVTRLKFVASVQTGIAKGKDNAGKNTIEVPYLRVANVQDGYLALDDVSRIEIPEDLLSRYSLQAGDVLMNEGGDFDKLGRGHIWSGEIEPCIHQNHVFAVRPSKISSDWLNTITGSGYAQFYFMTRAKQSTNLASISSTNIMELPVVVAPEDEQRIILQFLSRETCKIDDLMTEQEKLIALLKEKRQAVIAHAVTKGLDPSVPMTDSGIEWLGKVPQHWEVAHLKRFCLEITDGAHISPDTEGGVYHFVSTKDLSGDTIDFEGALLTSESSYEYLIKTGCRPFLGDVLFSKDGTIGRTVVVRDDREFVVASSLIIIRPDTNVLNADYLNFLCKSFLVATQVESFVKGAGLPRLSIQNLLKVLGVFPSKGEQEKIAAFLLGKLTQFDALITEAESAIDLLKERRTALISSAVTGQIDVRGLVKDEQEQAA
ncbi:Type I restriction modification DNA specificity domain protein [compost metagenome]